MESTISVRDYQRMLKALFHSARDYHTSIYFYSTAKAFLPFRIQSAEGRYFITWVDTTIADLPLDVGDEILSYNGQPMADVINEIKKTELGNPGNPADQAIAEMYLTGRPGTLACHMPSGFVNVEYISNETTEHNVCTVAWETEPEEFDNSKVYQPHQMLLKPQSSMASYTASKGYFQNRKMVAGFYAPWKKATAKFYKKRLPSLADAPARMGTRKSFVPQLGDILWQSENESFFHAYIFLMPNQKKIGYVRFNDYDLDPCKCQDAVNEFKDIISRFNLFTDGMVVDQLSNGGGYVYYMFALASLCTDYPLNLPLEKLTITQQDVNEALSWPDELEQEAILGLPLTQAVKDSFARHFEFVLAEWNDGRTFTNPAYLDGIQQIDPYPEVHYSKPILVLVNELDFSCADFFPAILQDNGRATIFGSRTAGAGGTVIGVSHPNLFGVDGYSLTSSIAYRANNEPIENLGVTPDIIYNLTANDLQNGYPGYRQAVLNAIDSITPYKPNERM